MTDTLERILVSEVFSGENDRLHVKRFPALRAALGEGEPGKENINIFEYIAGNAFSKDKAEKAAFVKLIDKTEPDIKRFADSRKDELAPVILCKSEHGYLCVNGERRCLAAAYSYAKGEGDGKVGAFVREYNESEALVACASENLQREDLTDVQKGFLFKELQNAINPKTHKKYKLTEVAEYLNLDYQFVHGRVQLTNLSEKDMKRVETGEVGVTAAIQRAKELKKKGKAGTDADIPAAKDTRQRALSLKQIQVTFDEFFTTVEEEGLDLTAETKSAKTSYLQGYAKALADTMQLSLEATIKESRKRLKEAAKAAKAEEQEEAA